MKYLKFWLGLVPLLQHFHGLGTCEMLTVIYIYFNFTIISARSAPLTLSLHALRLPFVYVKLRTYGSLAN